MTEESNLETLQRKVRTVQRRAALCYLVKQMLGDDKIATALTDEERLEQRPITLLTGSLPFNDSYRWEASRWDRHEQLSKALSGTITVTHIDPAALKRPHSFHADLHFAIYRGAIPAPGDLSAQEELLDRALMIIQDELSSIRSDLSRGESFPKVDGKR